jgi:hypothetical protein
VAKWGRARVYLQQYPDQASRLCSVEIAPLMRGGGHAIRDWYGARAYLNEIEEKREKDLSALRTQAVREFSSDNIWKMDASQLTAALAALVCAKKGS